MSKAFKEGAVVALKSAGAHDMVVTKVDSNKVFCIWYSAKADAYDERDFEPFVLVLKLVAGRVVDTDPVGVTPAFKDGDVVRLKSGGPEMVVTKVDSQKVFCIWTRKDGKYDERDFEPFVLEPAPKPAMSVGGFTFPIS